MPDASNLRREEFILIPSSRLQLGMESQLWHHGGGITSVGVVWGWTGHVHRHAVREVNSSAQITSALVWTPLALPMTMVLPMVTEYLPRPINLDDPSPASQEACLLREWILSS